MRVISTPLAEFEIEHRFDVTIRQDLDDLNRGILQVTDNQLDKLVMVEKIGIQWHYGLDLPTDILEPDDELEEAMEDFVKTREYSLLQDGDLWLRMALRAVEAYLKELVLEEREAALREKYGEPDGKQGL